MSSYKDTTADIIPIPGALPPENVPYVLDDFSLAMHLGVRCRTLWYLITTKQDLYKRFSIPKKSGGKRIIHAPEARLKYVQKQIDFVLLRTQHMGDSVGAYRPGIGCRYSVERHAGHYVRIALDIQDFFPSHSRARVRNFLKRTFGYDHRVCSMIADLCTVGERIASPKMKGELRLRHYTPQGSPASPTLCNLMAQEAIDVPVLNFLKGSGWVYTRYADDLTISHPDKKTRDEIQHIIDAVVKLVQGGEYREHRKKRRVQRQPAQQRMLGMVCNVHPNIPKYEYRRYRALLHNCLHHGFAVNAVRYGFDPDNMALEAEDALVGSFIAHLDGKINYFHGINPKRASNLRRQLDRAIQVQCPPDA